MTTSLISKESNISTSNANEKLLVSMTMLHVYMQYTNEKKKKKKTPQRHIPNNCVVYTAVQ